MEKENFISPQVKLFRLIGFKANLLVRLRLNILRDNFIMAMLRSIGGMVMGTCFLLMVPSIKAALLMGKCRAMAPLRRRMGTKLWGIGLLGILLASQRMIIKERLMDRLCKRRRVS